MSGTFGFDAPPAPDPILGWTIWGAFFVIAVTVALRLRGASAESRLAWSAMAGLLGAATVSILAFVSRYWIQGEALKAFLPVGLIALVFLAVAGVLAAAKRMFSNG